MLHAADILTQLAQINRRLADISVRLGIIHTEEENIVSLVDDAASAQAAETQEIATEAADVKRLLADFEALEAKLAGATGLTDAEKAELQTIVDSAKANAAALAGNVSAIDTADAPPAPTAPTPSA